MEALLALTAYREKLTNKHKFTTELFLPARQWVNRIKPLLKVTYKCAVNKYELNYAPYYVNEQNSPITYGSRTFGTIFVAFAKFSEEQAPRSRPSAMPIRFKTSMSSWISKVLSNLNKYSYLGNKVKIYLFI